MVARRTQSHKRPAQSGSAKAVAHRQASPKANHRLSTTLLRAATSRPAKAAYVAVGTVGLAALAVAILGPKRLEQEVLKPLQKAVGPQAEKLWDQSRPVRDQLTGLFRKAGDEREKLARDFQSWIGHFRAS
jgi:NAD/NADP transhydrogenase alpha subunit